LRKPAAASSAALLLMVACSPGAKKDNANDPYAGLEPEVLAWTRDVEATHPICKTKIDGKGCEGFEISCKGARDLTAQDRAKGVTAKVVAAVTFSQKTSDGSTGKLGSAFAEFSRANGKWTRIEAMPVNPSTCAAL
jgi:hypothetical protein